MPDFVNTSIFALNRRRVVPLKSWFLNRKASSAVHPGDSSARRTFLKRLGLTASSLPLIGIFLLGCSPKDGAGDPPRARTADAGSAGARPDAAATASRGVIP